MDEDFVVEEETPTRLAPPTVSNALYGGRPNSSHGGGETKMLDNVGGNFERKTVEEN